MSNPGINRWGLNLFWYRLWYTDKNNALTNHQDSLINQLILTYVHYGVLHYKNFFINKYWYFNFYNSFSNYENIRVIKYFRIVEYKNRTTNEHKLYKIRIKIKNLYFSKIWILRYQNWLLINFYFFQPTKEKLASKRRNTRPVDTFLTKNIIKNYQFMRAKLTLFHILNSILTRNIYYKF